MTFQIVVACVAVATLFLGLILHSIATAWWASKLTTIVEGIGESMKAFNKELEKRDGQIASQWSKIDDLKSRIITLEAQNDN